MPAGYLLDWSHQWFAGYPSLYFYFPLPALAIAFLTLLLPLEIAAKLFAVAAPAFLPLVTYLFVTRWGFSRLHGVLAAVAAVASLSMTSQYIYGGNVLSSIIGEYSFAVGLLAAVGYLTVLARAERQNVLVPLSVLAAVTALSHLIPTIFAVLSSGAALRGARARRQVVLSWAIGFGLSAFWSVPFLVRSNFMASIDWVYQLNLAPLFPLSVQMLLPWTIGAAVVLRRDSHRLRVLVVLGLAGLFTYVIPHGLFAQGRALPIWYYVLHLATGIGIATGILNAIARRRRFQSVFWASGIVMLVGASLIQLEIVRSRSAQLFSPATESRDWDAYDSLIRALSDNGPGRVHWEWRHRERELLGGDVSLARLPEAVTGSRSTVGLWMESSLMSPAYMYLLGSISWDSTTWMLRRLVAPVGRDGARLRTLVRLLGVDQLVTFSAEAAAWAESDPGALTPIEHGPQWSLWRTDGGALVEPLARIPTVLRPQDDWNTHVARWLTQSTDTSSWQIYPIGRTRLPADFVVPAFGARIVSAQLAHRRVSFRTTAPGVPHLIRVAYFPNWRTRDALGPFKAVPGFMIVVPHREDVEITFERTWVEYVGAIVSILSLVLVAGLAATQVWRHRWKPVPRNRNTGPDW